MRKRTLIQVINSKIIAMNNCTERGNHEWFEKHNDAIEYIEENLLPSGSGIDNGCIIITDFSGTKIVIHSSLHAMDDAGYYCGWQDFKVVARPTFDGADITLTRRGGRQISELVWGNYKDYLEDLLRDVLQSEVNEEQDHPRFQCVVDRMLELSNVRNSSRPTQILHGAPDHVANSPRSTEGENHEN